MAIAIVSFPIKNGDFPKVTHGYPMVMEPQGHILPTPIPTQQSMSPKNRRIKAEKMHGEHNVSQPAAKKIRVHFETQITKNNLGKLN